MEGEENRPPKSLLKGSSHSPARPFYLPDTPQILFSTGDLPPTEIPDHQLIRCIGVGSYGAVWLACNIMGTYRAVKIIYRQAFDHDRPYEREFEGIRRFEPLSHTHPSQLEIFHVGINQDLGYFYYIMELADDAFIDNQMIEGKRECHERLDPKTYTAMTLKLEINQRARLSVAECLQVGLDLAMGLDHLHRHDLVHRDIKPSNVIFVNGRPKLADIGLVTTLDATVSYVGTPGYFPPEGPGTPSADIYSLGKVLYEISMGKDRHEFPKLPEELKTSPDDELVELNAIVVKACQSDPTKRYQSAKEIQADLQVLHSGKSVKRLHWLEKQRPIYIRAAAIMALLTFLAIVVFFYQQRVVEESRWEAYLANVKAATSYLEDGNILELRKCLKACPVEFRNWEWQHLQLASDLSLKRFPHPRRGVDYRKPHRVRISVAFSPNAKRLLTGSWDGVLRLWDVGGTNPPIELTGHTLPMSRN